MTQLGEDKILNSKQQESGLNNISQEAKYTIYSLRVSQIGKSEKASWLGVKYNFVKEMKFK